MRLLSLLPLLVAGLTSVVLAADADSGKVVCYFGSWAVWRPNDGKFDVDDIDPFLCTHLIFGFAGLSNETWQIEVLDPWNELCPDEEGGNNCAYDRFVALKEVNPSLTVLLAVGGWREGSVDYSVMADDAQKRKLFIDSTIALIRKHGFDGLDLDWEYPASRGGIPEDKENFVTLIQEMRQEFDKFSPPLFMSTAMAAGKPVIDAAYDIKPLVDLFDSFHIMNYDYHGAWETHTHHNSPLCGYYLDSGIELYYNVIFTINYYMELGLPREKIVMGIPTYGRCWTLDSLDDTGMLAPAHAPGPAGPYIKIPGTLGFNEICKRFHEMDCTVVRDPALHEPYFYCPSDKIWCGFDDAVSVFEKARYAKNMGLAGFLVWTIDTDDFRPRCYDQPFHLVKSMKEGFSLPADNNLPNCSYTPSTTALPTTTTTTPLPTTTLPPTTTTTPLPTTIPSPNHHHNNTGAYHHHHHSFPDHYSHSYHDSCPNNYRCSNHYPSPNHYFGFFFPHKDCNKYWECINGQAILQLCGPGTLFDEDLMLCNWENQVDTSDCTLWICEVDNTYLPHADCDKYYRCYSGSPHLEQCPNGLYWNQSLSLCDMPSNVDTSNCNPV
ncbi:hypothetical protein O3P69_011314 [Scylla paramamosain]|uniref:Chitinase n=1 Tax=Scylla paramamosain TaxID=85552 RepID=A0AAW0SJQ0_SCYPA